MHPVVGRLSQTQPKRRKRLKAQEEFQKETQAQIEQIPFLDEDEEAGELDMKVAEDFWDKVIEDERLRNMKLCTTCQVRWFPRTSHCNICDNPVAMMIKVIDTGHNYRTFFFISLSGLGERFAIIVSMTLIIIATGSEIVLELETNDPSFPLCWPWCA